MTQPVSMPDEQTLRDYLLGILAADRAVQVEAWLASTPTAAEFLGHLPADDKLTAALAGNFPAPRVPATSLERINRSVLDALGAATSSPLNSTKTYLPDGPPGLLPVKLGSYRIVREIGRGGMGVVLEAEDEDLKRRVAIKVVALERASDPPTARARFLREAQATAAIDHENVVPIYHVGQEGGVPYLVMPLLRGESLQARLQREGPLPVAEVIRIGREVATGLAAAHARGLVHRDIKPANIWLEGEPGASAIGGRAKILDFGLARSEDGSERLTAPGAIPGTPAYLAPEQVDGLPADARSDLFSLGATLYECATGKRAFSGPTMTAILRAVTGHHPSPPHQVNPLIPAPLSSLIGRLIAKDPSARPRSAREVADELAGLAEKPAGTGRPRWWRILVPAAAALLLLGVACWLFLASLGGQRPKEPESLAGSRPAIPVQYQGWVNIGVVRGEKGKELLLPLKEPGALPMRLGDRFRIDIEVNPPAYLYVVWVDPGKDVTPVYPWNPTLDTPEEQWASRPAREEPIARLSLPRNASKHFTAPKAQPGVATMVVLARPAPLDVPDQMVRDWFESMPDLPLPPKGEHAAVWFRDYVEVNDPDRSRTFGEVGADDAFARWQGQMQKVIGGHATFETAVSFARTGRK